METLLKSGEFASLCRTTKETLRHYAKIGLLVPALQAENGYNYYAFTQFADFALISALQSTGLSLREIHEYLESPSNSSLNALLEDRIESIDKQIADLERKEQLLKGALTQARRLHSWFDDSAKVTPEGYRWRIVECPDEYFLETPAFYTEGKEDDFINSLLDHVNYCESQGWTATFQEAYRVDETHVVSGEYAGGFYAEECIPWRIDSERLRVKPTGVYLQWLNCIDLATLVNAEGDVVEAVEGDFSSSEDNPMFAAYDAMQIFASKNNIILTGDLYDVVLTLYGGSFKEAIYTEISRRIA